MRKIILYKATCAERNEIPPLQLTCYMRNGMKFRPYDRLAICGTEWNSAPTTDLLCAERRKPPPLRQSANVPR
ncbi:hypothetical protein [Prevotella disiens]|uniref:hypothetical protein n=1 Tax=Prevotella disiens TaxID=28130 RepID=UPI0011C1A90F|nr:hypothetical protein [Prevotella disiens]